ncbi:flagellar assembly lytic transglycosylase [Treponema pectinovorum]|uniref:flagellar assembly lytic transglycosylase n=1 Tax=Treponema pectinovorum TaxID=164 RepID=UPI0011C9B976|nr:lytic transglycosylase domain-containing protein [Treponema pectinovorum]
MNKSVCLSHQIISVAFLCLIFASACSQSKATTLKKQFKNDDSYFIALKALNSKDEKTAIRLFKESSEKSNPKIARLSAEKLTTIGSFSAKSKAADFLVKKYNDNEALLLATNVFFEQGEYSKIIKLTDAINFETASDSLILNRLESLHKKNDSRFTNEYFLWFTQKPLSLEHESFYSKYIKNQEKNDENSLNAKDENPLNFQNQIINFRILVWKKNYKSAFLESEKILTIYKNSLHDLKNDVQEVKQDGTQNAVEKKTENIYPKNLEYQILSDLGKANLYGSEDLKSSAQNFETMAASFSLQNLDELAYCAYFYAARLYDRAGRYQERVVKNFNSALDCIGRGEKFDNALWYLLNMQLRMSTDDIISTLKKYANKISDKAWFDDFFDNFSVLLLSHEKWQDFYNVWKLIDGYVSEETACKYAYISGRIIEEGFGKTDGSPKTKEAINAYSRVLSAKAGLYYKICVIERLNITDKTYVTDILSSGGSKTEKNVDKDAQKLLTGYAAYGFPELIYSQWLLDRNNISIESSIQACKFLNQCGKFDSDFSVQSLRIAARTIAINSGRIPYELLELNFPRFYSNLVEKACKENNLKEYLVYALIRSESFFDSKAGSRAGAKGLTQLMEATASDEAKRLKLPADFDIFDPETNIRLGTHYYARLIERSENKSELLALFAYNAGLTNVRRWKRPQNLSMDLYLETLPFQETREYGRKLVSAAAMYAFLYYDIPPAEVARSLLR